MLHLQKGKQDKGKDKEEKKRHSIALRPSKDRKASGSPKAGPRRPAQLTALIESPPLVMFGAPSNSSGALMSGRLKLDVTDPTGSTKLEQFSMKLVAAIAVKKPVVKDCSDCSKRVNQLTEWKFLSEPKVFNKDEDNQFPFSFLLPGHLPATTHTSLSSIEYSLLAKAMTSTGEEIVLTHPLKVQRALPPGNDKTSVRIFPPTNLAGRVQLPPVIYPIGSFNVNMMLSGVVDKKPEMQTRWRLRKLMWRIEEQQKITSPACAKHQHKLGEGKALQLQDTRIVGSDEIKSGWKTDFDTAGGEINMEFEASLDPSKRPICGVESPAGIEVKHNLVIELIVGEEFCPNKNPRMITPTGAARVLRMQFNLNVTDRAGLGISWDEEMPPVYEDVPDSPPGYRYADAPGEECTITDYTGEDIPYEDLEELQNENPNDPPLYRERSPETPPVRGESSQNPLPRSQRRAGSNGSTMSPRLQPLTPRLQAQATAAARGTNQWSLNDLETEAPPEYVEAIERGQSTEELDVARGETA